MRQYLGNRFCFESFLCVILCNTFRLDAFCLGVLFLVGTEQINVLIFLLCFGCGSGSSRAKEGLSGRARSRERVVLRCI